MKMYLPGITGVGGCFNGMVDPEIIAAIEARLGDEYVGELGGLFECEALDALVAWRLAFQHFLQLAMVARAKLLARLVGRRRALRPTLAPRHLAFEALAPPGRRGRLR